MTASRKRIYDAEFREGAVRIEAETGKPISEVAEDLGIHSGTMYSWVSRARRHGSPLSDRPVTEPSPGGRPRESERAESERLRAEAREKDKRIRELEMGRGGDDLLVDDRAHDPPPSRTALNRPSGCLTGQYLRDAVRHTDPQRHLRDRRRLLAHRDDVPSFEGQRLVGRRRPRPASPVEGSPGVARTGRG
ncbi:transposase [Streptomyces spongiae]|uniref:transposase n=1 Tax=Streptomyces spongiae TaxID=565072 RepID=UPI002AD53E8B|nr:transposase [Streptomyces spongiae]